MKRFLAIAALALATLATRAATPTYYSFSTNDFVVSPSLTAPAARNAITLSRTNNGTTNIFLNSTIIYTNVTQTIDNSTVTITNSYITITNTTININGNTNAFAQLWTNSAGVYTPTETQGALTATNITSAQSLVARGSFKISRLMIEAVAPGLNDITTSTNGFISIISDVDATDPSLRSIRLSHGGGLGSILILHNYTNNAITQSAFTLADGQANSDLGAVSLPNGDWTPTKPNEMIILANNGVDWCEIGRTFGTSGGGNTNFLMNPTDDYVPYRVQTGEWGDSPLKRLSASSVAVVNGASRTNSIELLGGNAGEIVLHSPVGTPSIVTSDTELYFELEGAGSRFRMGNLLFTPLTVSQASLGQAANPWLGTFTDSVYWGGHTASYDSGAGINPEGVITADPGSIWRNTSAGTVWKKASGTGDTGWVELVGGGGTINPTDGYLPYRSSSTTFGNSALHMSGTTNTIIDGQLIWGPGTTNVLVRDGADLVLTNQAARLRLVGSTASGYIGTGTGTFTVQSENTQINFGNSAKSIVMSNAQILPNSNDITLGGDGVPFDEAWVNDLMVYQKVYWNPPTNTVFDASGTGTPEGALAASVGSTFRRFNGGASTSFYVKESGSGNTGWVAK